jgi:hypothetical protein
MKNKSVNEIFEIISRKRLPVLTLDPKWLSLFPDSILTSDMRQKRDRLNQLLRKQGSNNEELRTMQHAKKRLMTQIIENMGADETTKEGLFKRTKLDKSQQLIGELNSRLEKAENEESDIPERIQEVNAELMAESTAMCYERFKQNDENIEKLSKEIDELRNKLKDKVLEKQNRESKNSQMYEYLFSVLGSQTMENLDRKNHRE